MRIFQSLLLGIIIGALGMTWFQAGTPPIGAAKIEPTIVTKEVEMKLTDSELYLMTEVLQDRIPKYDIAKYDAKKIQKDYLKVQKFVKAEIGNSLQFCLVHRGADECNVYKIIKSKLDGVKL